MPPRFTTFPLLPPELQDLIWRFTLLHPRIISGENCFHAWWHHSIGAFLLPAALQVCRRSRSLAKGLLKRTLISVPGISMWRVIYISQDSDFIYITKRDVRLEFDISTFIQNPAVVYRVLVFNATRDTEWCSKKLVRFFDQFLSLKEVYFTNRCEHSGEFCIYEPIPKLQRLFKDVNRDILVAGMWIAQ